MGRQGHGQNPCNRDPDTTSGLEDSITILEERIISINRIILEQSPYVHTSNDAKANSEEASPIEGDFYNQGFGVAGTYSGFPAGEYGVHQHWIMKKSSLASCMILNYNGLTKDDMVPWLNFIWFMWKGSAGATPLPYNMSIYARRGDQGYTRAGAGKRFILQPLPNQPEWYTRHHAVQLPLAQMDKEAGTSIMVELGFWDNAPGGNNAKILAFVNPMWLTPGEHDYVNTAP